MATPGNLSSKKVKNSYSGIVQHDGSTSKLYDGTGSMVNSIDVARVTASNAKIGALVATSISASSLTIDENLAVSGSTFLGDTCGTDQIKIHGNTWVSGALTVSGSCQGSLRSIGQAKFIYLENPVIEDQKPARVTRITSGYVRGRYNVPRFGGENAALDVYGNAVISGSLIVTDTVFAQEFHSEQISQSVMYTSGSTKFGGDWDDTMTVTGSLFQSGSDVYFLNGVGIGTTGSLKAGTFLNEGQDNPVEFTHLLRISDPGHDGLQHKNGKLVYGTFGASGNAAHISSSDTIRYRDTNMSEDVLVISSISQSIFLTNESDVYNVGIGAPSRSLKIDEKLVVSSSSDTRVKIESATGATSASLYLESGQSKWEIATVSKSVDTGNQISGSLVFRTQGNVSSKDTWTGNTTYNEALRLDKNAKAGFNIPSINGYQYPQQVQVSGSLNIIQGRTIDINAGTFHDSDGINGIYFNNQKMIYVSGSGANTSIFFGNSAGGTNAATGGEANIGFGYQSAMAMTTGDYNTLVGYNTGKALTTGGANVFVGKSAGLKTIAGDANIGIGTSAFYNSTNADYNVAIGHEAMKTGVTTGADNIAIGRVSLEDTTTGHHNISIGHKASLNLTTADNNIAIGEDALGLGIVTGNDNIAIGTEALEDATSASGSIAIGHGAAKEHTTGNANIAIGSGSMGKGIAVIGNFDGQNVGVGSYTLEDLTTGERNVGIGYRALDELTTGGMNIAIGDQAMSTGVTTGDRNIAIGKLAMKSAINASDNIAIGYRALRDATNTASHNIIIGHETAFDGVFDGLYNIIMGTQAAKNATTLDQNVILGYHAVRSAGTATGDRNVILGVSASAKLTTGTDNTVIGPYAGGNITTNTNNILLGNRPSASVGIDNAYAIGNRALVTQANSMVLGGQTGEKFNIGIGGITAPNATLEVSGTVNVTGSLTVSGSSTFTNFGKAVLYANAKNEEDLNTSLPDNRALEVSGTTRFHGHTYVTGNLYVSDIVVAQEFHTEYVSASITFTSGSNKMGDSSDDMQMMTGSLRVSGAGAHYYMGRQVAGVSNGVDNAKVGINTMTPAHELHVSGNAGFTHKLIHNDDTDTYIEFTNATDEIKFTAGNEVLLTLTEAGTDVVTVGDGGDVDFNVKTLGDDNTIYVLGSNDMVGIGMNNPTKKLHVTGDGHFTTHLTVDGNTIFGNAIADTHTITGHITASNNLQVDSNTILGNAVTDTHIFTGNVTASHNISASGFISSSHFAGTSASFDNIYVTGSGAKGTGSFGYVHGNTVHIHTHEIVGGQGLSVIGTSTDLGLAQHAGGSLDHNVQIYGPTTIASTLWVSASSLAAGTGHISASSMTLVNDLTILGNISASFISASKGLYSDGDLNIAGNITASGDISSSANIYAALGTGSFGEINLDDGKKIKLGTGDDLQIFHDGSNSVISDSGTGDLVIKGTNLKLQSSAGEGYITATANGAVQILHNNVQKLTTTAEGIDITGNVTASGNISSSGTGTFDKVIAPSKVLIGSASFANVSNPTNIPLYIVTGSGTNSILSSSFITLENRAASDLTDHTSFIDFKFTDTNSNVTPQVKIGAEVGYSDGNAGNQVKEGSGAFVVYTTSADGVDGESSNTEKFRVTHDGKVGIGASSPSASLHVQGSVTASGDINVLGAIRSSGSIASRNYRSFYIAGAGMTPAITNGATAATEERPGNAGTSNSYTTVDYLAFDGATNEAANFQIPMPGEWDLGSLKAKFYFMTNTATTNTVKWILYGTSVANNSSMNTTWNASNSGNVTTTPATSDDEFLFISATTGDIDVQGTAAEGSLVNFRVERDPSADTYTGDAHLLGVRIQYQERVIPEESW